MWLALHKARCTNMVGVVGWGGVESGVGEERKINKKRIQKEGPAFIAVPSHSEVKLPLQANERIWSLKRIITAPRIMQCSYMQCNITVISFCSIPLFPASSTILYTTFSSLSDPLHFLRGREIVKLGEVKHTLHVWTYLSDSGSLSRYSS